MVDRIAQGVTKCLPVLVRPPLVDGGGQLMELGSQLVEVGAQGGDRGGVDHRRAGIPAQRNRRVGQTAGTTRHRHVHPQGRWLRVPTGRHLYSLPQGPRPQPAAASIDDSEAKEDAGALIHSFGDPRPLKRNLSRLMTLGAGWEAASSVWASLSVDSWVQHPMDSINPLIRSSLRLTVPRHG